MIWVVLVVVVSHLKMVGYGRASETNYHGDGAPCESVDDLSECGSQLFGTITKERGGLRFGQR